MEKILKETYFNPNDTGSYGGVKRLYSKVKNKGISKKDVLNFLRGEDTYTLFKPVRKRFKTQKTYAAGPHHIWQSDLTDMQSYSAYNQEYRYLLFIIDVFSRYLWISAIKDKKPETLIGEFENLFDYEKIQPAYLHTDRGTEYTANKFQKFLKDRNIGYFNTFSIHKATIVERVQRTIKEKMHRYFHYNNTYKYINVLQNFVDSYNHSIHRGINSKPADKVKQVETRFKMPEGNTNVGTIKVGDYVRVSRLPKPFEKGYKGGWSIEIFTVYKKIARGKVPLYYLKDLNGDTIEGGFYTEELQKVKYIPDKQYKIEKILKTFGKGRNKKYLVKWLGYPESFNSVILASDLKTL